MEKYSKFIDSCAKLIGMGVSNASNIKHDVEKMVKNNLEGFIKSMDFVSRDELEAVKALALKALAANDELRKELGIKPARAVKAKVKNKAK